MVLLGIKPERLLKPAALRFKANLIAHTGARWRHLLLTRAPLVDRLFALIAHHYLLLLQWRSIVIGFFSPLRNKAKRRGDNNQANDNNEKSGGLLIILTHQKMRK